MKRNQLAPEHLGGRIGNLFLNLFWAVVWLGRWGIRLMRRLFDRKD